MLRAYKPGLLASRKVNNSDAGLRPRNAMLHQAVAIDKNKSAGSNAPKLVDTYHALRVFAQIKLQLKKCISALGACVMLASDITCLGITLFAICLMEIIKAVFLLLATIAIWTFWVGEFVIDFVPSVPVLFTVAFINELIFPNPDWLSQMYKEPTGRFIRARRKKDTWPVRNFEECRDDSHFYDATSDLEEDVDHNVEWYNLAFSRRNSL